MNFFCRFFAVAACALLAACTGGLQPKQAPGQIKIGKPYIIDGKTYYPAVDEAYDRTGQGSWYGPGFHGKYTASGEIFDENDLTAAHPTLPMPSLVRVTNLQNGKSIVARVNDRGPFKKNRIIDLSKKSALAIGLLSTGPVRVQYLAEETRRYLTDWRDSGSHLDMAQINRDLANNERLLAQGPSEAQIVESLDTTTQPGQPISSAAPVVTVASGEIAAGSPDHTADAGPQPVKLIREAAAEEPPVDDSGREAPAADSATVKPPQDVKPAPKQAAAPRLAQEKARSGPREMTSVRKPPPDLSPSAGGEPQQYIIRAGSFASEQNAKKLRSKLPDVPMVIAKVETGEKVWWRVHAGPFDNRELADAALHRVHQSGAPDARVVRQ